MFPLAKKYLQLKLCLVGLVFLTCYDKTCLTNRRLNNNCLGTNNESLVKSE